MTETKWTPGPWFVPEPSLGFSRIDDANGTLIFGIAAGSPDECRSEAVCEANARLIAAAPDLYEALDDLLFHSESGGRGDIALKLAIDFGDREALAVQRARAALAKARGESPGESK